MRSILFVVVGILTSFVLAAGQTTVTFRSGGGGGTVDNATRSCFFRFTTTPTSSLAWTAETDTLDVDNPLGYTLVEFPDIIGTGAGRIPPGAQILSAELRLYCTSFEGGTNTLRTLHAGFVNDPDRRGPWHEPGFPTATAPHTGVNWYFRDSRPGIKRGWNLAGSNGPTLLTAFPGLDPVISVVPNNHAPPATWGVGQYHAWDVTPHVFIWAQGAANQGFFISSDSPQAVKYASDDHATPTWRPQLEVTWAPGPPPINHVPRINVAAIPDPVVFEAGTTRSFFADATDADGNALDYLVIEPPEHGELVSIPPVVTYRPDPGFTGVDHFTFVARDLFATSRAHTVNISVQNTVGGTFTALQEGLEPAGALSVGQCRMSGSLMLRNTSAERSYEDVRLKVSLDSRNIFVSFPDLIGTGTGRVPAGAQILSARLILTTDTINSPGTDERVLSLRRIIDPLGLATSWREPSVSCPDVNPNAGCDDVGVSYRFRDSRLSELVPWLKRRGDVDSRDVASAFVGLGESGSVKKEFDVTAHVRAWAAGEPMHGWNLRSSSPSSVWLWADDAPVPANRPRLEVRWRGPAGAPLPSTVAPIAHAGPDLAAFSHETVTLDGTQSFHPRGVPFGVLWIGPVGLGGQEATLTPEFTAPVVSTPQVFSFFLLAYEDVFRFSIDTVRVLISPQPGGTSFTSPVPDAGPDVTAQELTTVVLNGSVLAPGATATTILWSQLDGPIVPLAGASTLSPSLLAPSTGVQGATLRFELEVEADHPGGLVLTARDYVTVNVQNAPNTPPVADAGPNATVEEGRWFTLDASASFDADGHGLTFTWSQTGGPGVNLGQYVTQGTAEAALTPFFAPNVPGSAQLTFAVAVSDGELVTNDTIVVTVVTPPPSFDGSLTVNPMSAYRDDLTDSEARHLLRRMGAGWHPDDVALVRQAGLATSVAFSVALGPQLIPTTIPDEALNYADDIAAPGSPNPPLNQPFDPYPQLNKVQLQAYWNIHAFRSQNFLNERLVRFWHDRLACSARSLGTGSRQWGPMYSDMLRAAAWGNYRDLLVDFSREALTLAFIDGFDNLAQAPNENFAREFMELHTLGVFNEFGAPIYTESDVSEAAKAFTGWRPSCYQLDMANVASCYPAYVPFFHNNQIKNVLGFMGNFGDEDMVDLVLMHDGGDDAARWLAFNLLEWFVIHDPPDATIAALAGVILQENWEIAPVISTMLVSRAMFAPEARRSLVSSPVDFTNGVARTLRVPLQTTDIAGSTAVRITGQMRSLDHVLGDPEDVDGWPLDLEWSGELGMLVRERVVEALLELAQVPTIPNPGIDFPGVPTTPVSPATFMPPPRTRFAAETLEVVARLLDIELADVPAAGASSSEFALIEDFMNQRPVASVTRGYDLVPDPFNGDQALHETRFWQLVMLLFQHPDAWRF